MSTGLRAVSAEPAGIRKGDTLKVFVLNMRGRPLMPCSPARARHLLKAGKAVVKRRTPFTIQLRIATGETKQNVTLGVDAGVKLSPSISWRKLTLLEKRSTYLTELRKQDGASSPV
jgi:hypothetical protein